MHTAQRTRSCAHRRSTATRACAPEARPMRTDHRPAYAGHTVPGVPGLVGSSPSAGCGASARRDGFCNCGASSSVPDTKSDHDQPTTRAKHSCLPARLRPYNAPGNGSIPLRPGDLRRLKYSSHVRAMRHLQTLPDEPPEAGRHCGINYDEALSTHAHLRIPILGS